MRVIDVINEQRANVIRFRCQFCGEITERHKHFGRTVRITQCRCDKWLEWIRFVFMAGALIILLCIAGGWQPFASVQYKQLEKKVITDINRRADEDQLKLMQNWRSQ